ncbi:glycosyl transferase [Vibrio lentus]|uniref:glycosyltransferase family 2 protein n=1 Tax=Vibrio lentus TaxID=136468 RepID=UPI000C866370|nr:glycosyltransferase family 2 protein [Vibrio lentus]PMH28885.1 glycosyl transferase [Vibrio lentus]PMK68452.1 glycosyl transferase [Vibrio lentus]
MKLSIVATLYKSEDYINEFCERASTVARSFSGEDYEIILVDDGSPDNSLNIALALQDKYHQLKVIELSRNFGHHKAMLTGLEYAKGELIYLLDSDLEEEPEWLISFHETMIDLKSDVVFGVQESRKGGVIERVTGNLFYTIFNKLAHIEHPRDITTARLMSKAYLKALLSYKESEVVFSCLCELTGFKQISYTVKKHSSSETTYSTIKKIRMMFDSIISFSSFPLELMFYCGIFIFIFSVSFAGYLIGMNIFFQKPLEGWTSIVLSIWTLSGLMFTFLGIIGMYISKIFNEVKMRPRTVVKGFYNFKD